MSTTTSPFTAVLLILVAPSATAGCGESIDPVSANLPSAENYSDWDHFDYHGNIPGHGESWRDVFVNPVGRSFLHGGRYPVGTVIVKEIRNLSHENDGTPSRGGLRYIAIMRKVGEVQIDGVPVERGWVFTKKDSLEGGETYLELCWASCHRAAPLDGAFYDYGQ